ncbi:hypothetical protein QKU48_gp0725 [Fadolivirus algeromassiliense]|jgi:hypothetical protein|uniref:Uncharacterized protein n=1 Tax=Fadolivirus FV1/VV64 TaxID=3070911 RepID=A0A7D3QUJ7_9VIRU|nr:hypothetical protein QKU48_gp0725 [Fadolivirus algeromassiliense]QKF94183.1 hypothetical protein Fadolivirus_1_725 [Fadolivirus FV1/VV64]
MEHYNELLEMYNKLKKDYDNLLKEKEDLELQLKKYTSPERKKKYYENHKEEIKQKVKEYNIKTGYKSQVSEEKRKEYNRRAYLKRKNKTIQNKV